MKDYMEFNTEQHKKCKNDFETNFFRLMNNSCLERRWRTWERGSVSRWSQILRNSKSLHSGQLTWQQNFQANKWWAIWADVDAYTETNTCLKPTNLCWDALLDLWKTVMYDFHYNYTKARYGIRARLLLTDRDSLMYKIQTEGGYEEFWK